MSLILKSVTSGVNRVQPHGNATIDWSSHLASGLVFDTTPTAGPFNNAKNVMAASTSGVSTRASALGLGYSVSTAVGGNCVYFSTQGLLNSYPFSILLIADTITQDRRFVFETSQNTAGPTAKVRVIFNGTATAGATSDSSGKLYLLTVDTGFSQNSPAAGGIAGAIVSGVHSYGITCDGTTTSYYRDGRLIGTESPVNNNNVWSSTNIISVGGAPPNFASTRTFDRSMVLARMWNGRLLTEHDFLDLHENPWQLYVSKTRDKWVTPTIASSPGAIVSREFPISQEIRKNFASFYLFGDASTTKKDLIGKNDLTYIAGSPQVFKGKHGQGEKFSGSSYLANRSISPTVDSFPFFIYIDVEDTGDPSLDGEPISLSPWVTNYTRQVQIFMSLPNSQVSAILTDSGGVSYSNKSKTILSRIYTAALVARSYTDFTLFVNGEKLTPFQTTATGFTSRNAFTIGRTSNGGGSFRGGVYSAGWGTKDPGDDFFRRLTINPLKVINPKSKIIFRTPVSYITKQRVTLSSLGTRSGKRQAHP